MSDDITRKRLEKAHAAGEAFAFELHTAECMGSDLGTSNGPEGPIVIIRMTDGLKGEAMTPEETRKYARELLAAADSAECPRCNPEDEADLPCKQHPPSAIERGEPCALDGCKEQATACAISDQSMVRACDAHVDQIAQALDDSIVVRGLQVVDPPSPA